MRKVLCLLVMALLCVACVAPAMAAEGEFVPSISYKDSPDLDEGILNDDNITDCLVISSIMDAREKTTDITQEARDLLLDVYRQLSDGSMTLPLENDYVIRELVDVSFKQKNCIEPDHLHEDELEKPGVTIEVTFDLDVDKDTKVTVMHYHDGEWIPVISSVNNGDGTITCVFEHFCPVVFCVDKDREPSQTGDTMGRSLVLWIVLMIASMVAVCTLLLQRRKFVR